MTSPSVDLSLLEIDTIIGAHKAWYRRFEFTVIGIYTEPLDAAVVGDCQRCVLNDWLLGAGQRYAALSTIQQLTAAHSEFHAVAAQIALLLEAKRSDEANRLLDGDLKFCSERIVARLHEIQDYCNRSLMKSGDRMAAN